MKQRLLIAFLFFSTYSFSQHSKFITFDLLYLENQTGLAPSQKEKLDAYLNHVSLGHVVALIIDTSISKANSTLSQSRITFLNQYLIDHGINESVIQVLQKNKTHSEFVHDLSDEFDALKISISYTSTQPLEKLEIPEPKESIEKTMLTEGGIKSTSSSSEKLCMTNVVVPLIYNYELTMNSCDYDKNYRNMVFTPYNQSEVYLLKHLPILSQTSHILGAYDLRIQGGEDLFFPATLKIPIEHCMDKKELTLFYCKDSTCQLIPMENVYSPDDDYISFKIEKTGIYFLIHFNQRHEYQIDIKLKGKYKIQEFEFNTRCHNMTYVPDIKKNKVSITLTESFYEPVISIRATDHQGRVYRMTNKPLSLLDGKDKIKDFRVHNFYSDIKTERTFPLFKKYNIDASELKLVQEYSK